jgi:hypothetical protein
MSFGGKNVKRGRVIRGKFKRKGKSGKKKEETEKK